MFHVGMDKVKPLDTWIPRIGHRVTLGFGEPLDAHALVKQAHKELFADGDEADDDMLRERVTQLLRLKLLTLREQVLEAHEK
jgi:hypothetical protein